MVILVDVVDMVAVEEVAEVPLETKPQVLIPIILDLVQVLEVVMVLLSLLLDHQLLVL